MSLRTVSGIAFYLVNTFKVPLFCHGLESRLSTQRRCLDSGPASFELSPSSFTGSVGFPGAGDQILLGRDQILSLDDHAFLHPETITLSNQNSVVVLAQAKKGRDPITLTDTWKSSADLGLSGSHGDEWNIISPL